MSLEVRVSLDLQPLEKYFALIVSRQSRYNTVLMGLWAIRYRRDMLKRWREESRGGGEWPALKASTIKRRRNKVKGSIKILIDTGILRDALTPDARLDRGKPGAYASKIPMGLRVGFGGPDQHRGTGVSVARLALYHHTGAGRLPVRTLLVEPGLNTLNGMRSDVKKVFNMIKKRLDMS